LRKLTAQANNLDQGAVAGGGAKREAPGPAGAGTAALRSPLEPAQPRNPNRLRNLTAEANNLNQGQRKGNGRHAFGAGDPLG